MQIADAELKCEIRGVLQRDDDYSGPGKPVCDWDDAAAREELVDALARDAQAVVALLDDRPLAAPVLRAVELCATVVGQDIEPGEHGRLRILRGVAKDRIISVVDPEARHGHKTAARGFDGYKGHVAIDPDSELIVATEVTAGNVGDAVSAAAMLGEVLEHAKASSELTEVYGDASYGTADLVEHIESAGARANVKVQAAAPPHVGMYSQDAFTIDTKAETARCPGAILVQLRRHKDGSATAAFGAACTACPLRGQCTTSPHGRTVSVHAKYDTLHRSRERQRDPAWKQCYRATRPKVERKIAHLMRRKHGGRRARVRGRLRVGHDFALLAAAVNLARLARLRVTAAARS